MANYMGAQILTHVGEKEATGQSEKARALTVTPESIYEGPRTKARGWGTEYGRWGWVGWRRVMGG